MVQEKTPGVYIHEENAFPNSVVEVATAVPAFLGFTEKAKTRAKDLTGVPTRIDTMSTFEQMFGGPSEREFSREVQGNGAVRYVQTRPFYLHAALRMFFNNGGGPCWIVSVGGYGDDTPGVANFGDSIWQALAKEEEPTIYVCPDAVALDREAHVAISNRMLAECQSMADRIALLDVYDGAAPVAEAIENPRTGFRNALNFSDNPSFGVAYFPWVDTNLLSVTDVDFTTLDKDSRAALAARVQAEAERVGLDPSEGPVKRLTEAPSKAHPAAGTHRALLAMSQAYKDEMEALVAAANRLPPSGAVAGVYARTDATMGVWKAPANTGIVNAVAPCVAISDEEQGDLNAPLNGLAVNAIRAFPGRGVLIWGARTLAGNLQDFRYVNVRRTMIMLEESIKKALEAFVFEANDSTTWMAVQSMIKSFLSNQWKAGALAGATPEQAFDVAVGLGSTMTGQDILGGYMRVSVRVAVVHPAEFIVITFLQKMQES